MVDRSRDRSGTAGRGKFATRCETLYLHQSAGLRRGQDGHAIDENSSRCRMARCTACQRRIPVPRYRLVFMQSAGQAAIRSVSFSGQDPGEALILAQRHKGPAELWSDDRHICTIRHAGNGGGMWIITGNDRADGG